VSALRAADADRDAVATLLRRSHAEGRLDTAELEERIERCYAAKTVAELDALVADLPHERRATPALRPRRSWPVPWFVPVALVLLAIATITGNHVPWIAFPLAFLVFGRLLRAGRGYRMR
jgi:hypothetical protein